MSWHAKPSQGYAISSAEGTDNINEYYNYFISTTNKNNIVGQLCNVFAESGLNPWRWQGDTVNLSAGYGLYQFTEASAYINLTGIPGHSPNMSTTEVQGGNVSDAEAQMYVFINDTLSKWGTRCWRRYWNEGDTWEGAPLYPDLYTKRTSILNTYGDGNSLSMAQFFNINNTEDACFAFLACYEGPRYPNLSERMQYAQAISDAISGPTPPTPHGPVPIGGIRDLLRRQIIFC